MNPLQELTRTQNLCGSRRSCGADATSAADPPVGLPGEQRKPDEGVRRGPGVGPTFCYKTFAAKARCGTDAARALPDRKEILKCN
jgi:hypothetical protein